MKKEYKVGLLGIISILILYFGFNFLKGLDIFSQEDEFIAHYAEVDGLQTSNPVLFQGVAVGRVVSVEPDQENDRVKVRFGVSRKIKLTDKSLAVLTDNGLIGGKIIKIVHLPGNPIEDEAEIKGVFEKGIMAGVWDKLSPTMQNVDSLIVNLNKTVKQFDHTGNALKVLLANATQTTHGVNGIIAANSANLAAITSQATILTKSLNVSAGNLSKITSDMDSQIKPILSKTNTFTDSLNALRLGETVMQLNRSVASLQGILHDINAGKGTVGQLAKNDSLYLNLDKTAASLNTLIEDLKNNPKRYVHFSLFGKK